MPGLPEKKKILIICRTYPTPARKGVEVSCTGGITENNEWIRLFPVPYRFLEPDKRFRKYQWIEASIKKASDPRPESYNVDCDSIKILSEPISSENNWQKRKDIIYRLRSHCLCCLQKERDQKGFPTLGIFKPKKIDHLVIEPDKKPWTQDQLNILRQGSLLNKPIKELEKVPYNFRYSFQCDHNECPGHTTICTDWEAGESWRKWRDDYADNWESKFRQKYESEMIRKLDTHFYVGTVHAHPQTWIIVGLFYPPYPKSGTTPSLFE